MLDAIPYMADYPYGCTEQTLNRFLPAVIARKTLQDMGLNLEDIYKKRTNLNTQELDDPSERTKQWKRLKRDPVFNNDELKEMVKEGIQRLAAMQISDGGWGWFSGWGEQSWPHTTAIVVHGLLRAKQCDVALFAGMLERGIAWLENYQTEQIKLLKNWEKKQEKLPCKPYVDNIDALVFFVLSEAGKQNMQMKEYLYRDRLHLSKYGMVLIGLAFHMQNDIEKRDMIMRNLRQYLVEDHENQTAWLNLENDSYWWYWYGSEYEALAFYIKLLSYATPHDPVIPALIKYLLNNRKHATYWDSTRDTALCLESFADFLKATDEHKPDMTVVISLDGIPEKEIKITSENLFSFDNIFIAAGNSLADGNHTVEITRHGKGNLYINAYLQNFTLEDFITKTGLEIKVERRCYRLQPVDKKIKTAGDHGQVIDQKVEKYERELLETGSLLKSGDLMEVELIIESKNDYEYLVFEDMKAAGFEPVELQSGYTKNDLGAYVEFRDEKVVFFVRTLARGKHSVSYRLRAEIPGHFSALPAKAYAMYAPELKANSDEMKLKIED